ncbi:MAG: ABC transporter permease, partial [Pseudomonadota bacterium]
VVLPVVIVVLILLALGAGVWLSALNAKYRDVQQIVPYMITLGLYVSPVGFSTAVVPEKWRWLFQLNPMAGVIDAFRWCIFGDAYWFIASTLLNSLIVAIALLTTGLLYSRAIEREIVYVI